MENSTLFAQNNGVLSTSDKELRYAVPAGPARDRIDELIRHERLLHWVSAIAEDMTSRRDLDDVMNDILETLHKSVGVDMAYVSLNTADETFIRYSSGVRTEGYRTIRMPLGSGVLGKAATGRSIVATSDYLTDPHISHIGTIDQLVQAEGVRSILAVPMTLHGIVYGALLVADRKPRLYPPELFDTLTILAQHTSVVLANAQRISQVSEAMARLHETHEKVFLDTLLREGRIPDLSENVGITYTFGAACPSVILAISSRGSLSELRENVADLLAYHSPESLLVPHGPHICVLTRSAHLHSVSKGLLQRSKAKGLGIRVGISPDFSFPDNAKIAHENALQALETLNVLAVDDRVLNGGGLGTIGLLVEAIRKNPNAPSPLNAITPLTEHDSRKHTDLTRTAWALVETTFHISSAASMLHLHENTVRQRAEKIAHLLGDDWRTPERLLDIHVALRMWALAAESPQSPRHS